MSVPPSREVRLQAGVTEDPLEDMLYRAHTGPTSDLVPIINGAELYVESQRSKAGEILGGLLLTRLTKQGYLTVACIKDTLREWHELEVLLS